MKLKGLCFLAASTLALLLIGCSHTKTSGMEGLGRDDADLAVRVNEVKLSWLKSNPPQLAIQAKGVVPATNYELQLDPIVYIQPPPDGIWEYNLRKVKQGDVGGPAQVTKTAETVMESVPKGLKGIRVWAQENSRIVRLRSASGNKP